jgi:phospholipase/carboxylesterase
MAIPETIEVETRADPSLSVIWLHGLGADGHDFEPLVPELRLPAEPGWRFVFPHAPERAVTINNGMVMRAWYDILSFDRGGPADESGIRASGRLLDALIERERARGIAAGRIVVAGFSQGGAIALHAGLRSSVRLAGIMALSTYLPLQQYFEAEVVRAPHRANAEVPIFMAHGRFDPVLTYEMGIESAQRLRAAGFSVEWHEYPMAHSVCAEEVVAIRAWLLSVAAGVESET